MSNREARPKGAQATADNKRRYSEKIAKMEALGEKFTTNQYGKVNVGAFAAQCGFSRFVLEKGALAGQFAADVERIGVDVPETSRLQKKAEDRQKMASNLQRMLNVKTAECEILRKQVEKLTMQVCGLTHGRDERERTLEHLLSTGERFFI